MSFNLIQILRTEFLTLYLIYKLVSHYNRSITTVEKWEDYRMKENKKWQSVEVFTSLLAHWLSIFELYLFFQQKRFLAWELSGVLSFILWNQKKRNEYTLTICFLPRSLGQITEFINIILNILTKLKNRFFSQIIQRWD